MSIHEGHRERLKQRFRAEGLENFSQINALELLLFYCVPRKDTNPLAHALLDHFGSFDQVLEAPVEELEKVPGVGPNISTYLSMLMQTSRYYHAKLGKNEQKSMQKPEEYGEYLHKQLAGRRNETVYLLCLDAKCKLLCSKKVGEGSVNSASIPIRKIVEMALAANATSVVLAHNHPSGLAVPSHEDVQTTLRLARALDSVEIILADHVIVAENEHVSLLQSGWYDPRNIGTML